MQKDCRLWAAIFHFFQKGDLMKQSRREKTSESYRWRTIQNPKVVLAIFFALRGLVVATMIAQFINGNYESVWVCILTLVLFALPSFVERRLHIDLPDALEIGIYFFIFAAEILGEINEYYLLIPFWDTLLHTINGFLFAAIGFCTVNFLNEDENIALGLSPAYIALAAFCFSMTIGVFWEFFEWGMDAWFGLDMQKDTVLNAFSTVNLDPAGSNTPYMLTGIRDVILVMEDGSQVAMGLGGYLDVGLQDTMTDLFVNFVGALVFSVLGFFYVQTRGKGKIAGMFIPRVMREPKTKDERE